MMKCVVMLSFFAVSGCFRMPIGAFRHQKISMSTWQEDLDKFLDVDTECGLRGGIATDLLQKVGDISNDLVTAIQDRDVKKVAPPSLKYGKAVVGLQALQRQIINDILPDFLAKGVPKIVESGPKIINQLIKEAPERGQEIFSTVRELTQDPSALQSTVDDIRNEVKNSFRSTPVGLETPTYVVERTTDEFEIRKYSAYSLCTTKIDDNDDMASDVAMVDPISSGTGFNTLASYIFGKNVDEKKLSMTTPVIVDGGYMGFVLSGGLTAETAPSPTSSEISLKDIEAAVVAVREFPGIATDGEVSRQRALLEDSLLSNGIIYDNLSFKVLQYNSPLTLPWLRRNEVCLTIDTNSLPQSPVTPDIEKDFQSKDSSEFFSAPEAGD